MIKDNEARFEEEDALEDEMAESEKEEKVEDVYKFQGCNSIDIFLGQYQAQNLAQVIFGVLRHI